MRASHARVGLACVIALRAWGASPARADAPKVHASASCTAASKPGRIRCRAVLELPLDAATTQRLAWSELRITAADASVTPLRGRLGPLDAESRDDGRIVWTFSVAASAVGDRTMTVRLSSVVEPKNAGAQASSGTFVEHRIDVLVRVSP